MNLEMIVKKQNQKVIERMMLIGKKIKKDTFMPVIEETRIDTGLMRGNWQTTRGTTPASDITRYELFGSMAKGYPAMNQMLRTISSAGVNLLVNRLHYVDDWEPVDRMVAMSVSDFRNTVSDSVRVAKETIRLV